MHFKLFLIVISIFSNSCQNDQIDFSSAQSQKYQLNENERAEMNRVARFTFHPAITSDHSANVPVSFEVIKQDITLKQKSNTMKLLQQKIRATRRIAFSQGSLGLTSSENFAIKESGLLDLLIVMDNSGSMGNFQKGVAQRLTQLLSSLHDVDWKIVATTTSTHDDFCLRKTAAGKTSVTRQDYISNKAQALATYKELIQAGTDGSVKELGIKAAALAAQGNCGNKSEDWKRPGSHLGVLIVSDEMHCGSAPEDGCIGKPWDKKDYFLNNMPRSLEKTSVYGLLLLKNLQSVTDPFCPLSGGYPDEFPSEYIGLIKATKGLYGEICQEDYSSVLSQISKNVASRVVNEFQLAHPPIASTLEVLVDDEEVGYRLEDQKIILTEPKSQGTLRVNYRHGQSGFITEKKIPNITDQASIQIKMSGQEIAPSQWNFNPETGLVTFIEPPEENSQVEITFKTLEILPRQFQLRETEPTEDVRVKVNGIDFTEYTFDREKNELHFSTPPEEGALIEVSMTPINATTTQYVPINIHLPDISEVWAEDAKTKEPLAMRIENHSVEIPASEVYEGRKVSITFKPIRSQNDLSFTLPLSNPIWKNSVTVTTDSKAEPCNAQVQEANIIVKCANDSFNQMTVTFITIDGINRHFNVSEAPSIRRKIEVLIDGRATDQFDWQDKDLIIQDESLSPSSVIDVTISAAG